MYFKMNMCQLTKKWFFLIGIKSHLVYKSEVIIHLKNAKIAMEDQELNIIVVQL